MDISVNSTDGFSMGAWMQAPQGPVKGGIVILQEIFGLTDYVKSVCAYWADRGYVTIAPSLFDRQKPAVVIDYASPQDGLAYANGADMSHLMQDIAACIHYLKAKTNKVFVLGFCWGGGIAYKAACTLDFKGAACIYPTRVPTYFGKASKLPLQFHFGLKDDHIPVEQRQQIANQEPSADIVKWDAGHGFDRHAATAIEQKLQTKFREKIENFFDSL